MARQKEQARAAGKFKMAANLEYSGPATTFHGYDTLEAKGNVLALYKDGAPVNELHRRRDRRRGARRHAVLRRIRRPGRRPRRAAQSAHGIFAVEDTQKIQAAVFGHHGVVEHRQADGRRWRQRAGRPAGARAHHAQPLGHAPDAQGLARSARRACAAEGFAGRSGQDALRLRPQPADDRRRDPPRRAHRQCRNPRQCGDAGARAADRRGAEDRVP